MTLGCAIAIGVAACGPFRQAGTAPVDRERAQTFYKDARGYAAVHEFASALGSIRQAESFDPDSSEIRAYRQRLVRAVDMFQDRLVRSDQSHVFLEGVAKYVAAEYRTALLCLSSALGNRPLDDRLQRFIKDVEKESGHRADPGDMRPTAELVALKLEASEEHFNNGRLTEAMLLCRDVTLLQPDNALAYTRLGSIAYARKEYDEARRSWRQALALKPGDRDIESFLKRLPPPLEGDLP